MNKKILIGIGIIIVTCLIVTLKILFSSTAKQLELTYKTNGGVPYKWEYKIEDESIVKFVGTKDITPDEYKNLSGGLVYTNYIFKGLKEGKTTITFKYVSIVDNTVDKEEKVTVKVDNHKNISLVANS